MGKISGISQKTIQNIKRQRNKHSCNNDLTPQGGSRAGYDYDYLLAGKRLQKIKGITNASGLRLRLVMPFYYGIGQIHEQV